MAHQVTVQPSGNTFTVPEGDTILAAALNEGFHLPYGCRNGACGSCKGKLVAGAIDYGKYQHTALSADERAAGYALFCVAKPLSDVTIESREIGAVKDIVVRKLPCRVHRIERVTDDVVILQLKLPANERLQFLAGQYIEFILKEGARRSFSMANAPHEDEFLQLHVRHVPGGSFTDHVFNTMKERDILRFEGPLGSFFLHESEKPIVFVASGTGFAPIKAIIESAFKHNVGRPMTLYWGGRRPQDLYLDALAREWAAEYPALFDYVPVISDALPEDGWTGRTGFVHRAVMADMPDLSGVQVYACGVPIMVESARRDFTHECGLPIDEFFADSFTTQADLAAG
ncbi:MAG TPA: CDP-6-deoxy-delta-3,4-glucoseen reductase [Burkholderiales bacterium]|nr:CDP-6-deoxy-delta-3,4-glucoseen reductase [Burkholderiales bacterium]